MVHESDTSIFKKYERDYLEEKMKSLELQEKDLKVQETEKAKEIGGIYAEINISQKEGAETNELKRILEEKQAAYYSFKENSEKEIDEIRRKLKICQTILDELN